MSLRPNPLIPLGAVRVIDRQLERLRTEVCTVQEPVHSQDEGGAPVRDYGTTGVYSCRVVQLSAGAENVGGGRFQTVSSPEVRLPREAIVSNDSRIIVGDLIYEVTADVDIASHGTELRVPVSVAR